MPEARAPLRVWALAACGLLIAVSVATIVWRLSGRPAARTPPTPRTVARLLARPWATETGAPVDLRRVTARYLVFYLFTPQDCAACLAELAALSRYGARQDDLAVLAVMGYSNRDEALQTRRNLDLEIPILQDPHGEFLDAIAPPQRPWKLVVEVSAGEVLFEEAAAVDGFGVERFLGRLEGLASS